jgi:hypothetical protein
MACGIADEDDTRRDRPFGPVILVRIGVEWPDRLASCDAFAQGHTLQAKLVQQISLSPDAGEPFPSLKTVAGVEAEFCAALRKDEMVEVAFCPRLKDILRPLWHAVYEHSADEIVRFVVAHCKAELAPNGGVTPVGTDDETRTPSYAPTMVFERE